MTYVDTDVVGVGAGMSGSVAVVDAPIYERVHGRDGQSLAQRWKGSPRAYKGVTMSGCPNAFILRGPKGSSASVCTAVESLGYMRRRCAPCANAAPRACAQRRRLPDRLPGPQRRQPHFVPRLHARNAARAADDRSGACDALGSNEVPR